MSDTSKIEWTDATWNPVTGCSKVSQGCKNCYALRDWARLSSNPKSVYYGREFTDVRTHAERLDQPMRWRRPRRIFVNSMSDLFHEDVPEAFIDQVWKAMLPAKQHTFQILTKRPERMLAYLRRFALDGDGWVTRDGAPAMGPIQPGPLFADNKWPPRHIWLGVSVEDQDTVDERIPLLLKTPAAVRFISAEPLLGPITFEGRWIEYKDPRIHENQLERLNWVIAGGESGPAARPTHPDWIRSLRDQCAAAGVAFFFKQWGEWAPRIRHDQLASLPMNRVGKKTAGRILDGRSHDAYPT